MGHASWKLMFKDYNPTLTEDVRQTYVQGQNIDVQVQITAYHGGFMSFHLCPVKAGELDFDVSECGLLEPANSAAYNRHLLNNLTYATLPMPSKFCSNCASDSTGAGFCGYNPGCLGDGPDGFAVFDITLEPSQIAMDHGVLVWHWFTANNGEGFVGGEEFMNCTDVRISPSGSAPAPSAAPGSTTIAPPATTTTRSTSTASTSLPSSSATEPPTARATHPGGQRMSSVPNAQVVTNGGPAMRSNYASALGVCLSSAQMCPNGER